MSFLDDIKADLVEGGVVTEGLFTYIDDRINELLSVKISEAMADNAEQMQADIIAAINKQRYL
jgi:hypothetical protein